MADGIHLVATCLARGVAVRQLLVSESGLKHAEVATLLHDAAGLDCLCLRDSLFRELSGVATPTGIAAVIDIPPVPAELSPGDAVLLEAVQDAGNVGAILRTAAAAGVRNILLGPGCAGAWTSRVLRGGQGAHFSLDIREQVDLPAALAGSSATPVATVAHDGMSLYEVDLRRTAILAGGQRGRGPVGGTRRRGKSPRHDSACRRNGVPECGGGHGGLPVRSAPPAHTRISWNCARGHEKGPHMAGPHPVEAPGLTFSWRPSCRQRRP
jgi:TrmH family RNA methyltransferase